MPSSRSTGRLVTSEVAAIGRMASRAACSSSATRTAKPSADFGQLAPGTRRTCRDPAGARNPSPRGCDVAHDHPIRHGPASSKTRGPRAPRYTGSRARGAAKSSCASQARTTPSRVTCAPAQQSARGSIASRAASGRCARPRALDGWYRRRRGRERHDPRQLVQRRHRRGYERRMAAIGAGHARTSRMRAAFASAIAASTVKGSRSSRR